MSIKKKDPKLKWKWKPQPPPEGDAPETSTQSTRKKEPAQAEAAATTTLGDFFQSQKVMNTLNHQVKVLMSNKNPLKNFQKLNLKL